jgi:hypothetical protein
MSKIIEAWHGARVDPSQQLIPLGPLPILNRIQVIKLGTTSTLNLSLNFYGVQTFLEKSDKFSKIPCLLDILEYNFILNHLYSNIGSFFTSGKNDLVKFILKIAGHLGVLGTLPQLHY